MNIITMWMEQEAIRIQKQPEVPGDVILLRCITAIPEAAVAVVDAMDHRFTILIRAAVIRKEATTLPVPGIGNITATIAEPYMTGMEMDMVVTALQHMTVEDTVILPVEEGAALRAIAFPAA